MTQILHLEGDCLQIKGATKVISSTQTQAVIETTENGIVVLGNEIEVKKLNLEEGEIVLNGKFSCFKFGAVAGKKQPLLKRIFK